MSKVKIAKKVKLWNRHDQDYKQIVNGMEICIPSGKYIQCSRREGLAIRGHYPGKGVTCKLEIEPIYEEVDEPEVYMDHRTGEIFSNRAALLKHLGIDEGVVKANFKCGLCETSFPDRVSLAAHMQECLPKFKKETKAAAAA